MIIIDGYCENWLEIMRSHPGSRIIMAVRANTFGDLDREIKKQFKIVAKTGVVEDQNRIKGIVAIKNYS